MRKAAVYCLIPIITFGCGNAKKKDVTNDSIAVSTVVEEKVYEFPTLDVNASYSKKEITLQDIADIRYIPIETTDDVLLGNNISALRLISENKLVIVNYKNGDCYIFDGEGKVKNHFNHTGGSGEEYKNIIDAVVDEERNEIYIYDYGLMYRIQVYSLEGKYKRTLWLPNKMMLGSMHNYNAESILIYDNRVIKDEEYSKQPYILLSKTSGKVLKRLDNVLSKRISSYIYEDIDEHSVMTASFSINSVINDRAGYIIGDISSDTIYSYSEAGEWTAMMARKPPVIEMEVPIVTIPEWKTNDYFFLVAVKLEFDFKTNTGFPDKSIVYDYKEGKFFECTVVNKDYPGQSLYVNSAASVNTNSKPIIGQFIPADKLIEENSKGNIHGELKTIASTLKDDDNPVLMLLTLKD